MEDRILDRRKYAQKICLNANRMKLAPIRPILPQDTATRYNNTIKPKRRLEVSS
jgi:hypothetical protein